MTDREREMDAEALGASRSRAMASASVSRSVWVMPLGQRGTTTTAGILGFFLVAVEHGLAQHGTRN